LLVNVHNRCKLNATNSTKFNEGYPLCDSTLKISPSNGYLQQPFIHFVRDSAYAFAFALHNMHKDLCKGIPGVCDAMSHVDGPDLMEYLKNVTFKGSLFSPYQQLI